MLSILPCALKSQIWNQQEPQRRQLMNTSFRSSMNRREFISSTAALGLAAVAAPVSAETIKGKPIRIGFVGLGGRGGLIADNVAKMPGYEIAALCDYFEEVVHPAGVKYNVPANRCFSGLSGYRKLLDCDVDAVIFKTPPCFFPEHVAAGVDAGKHVYFAKPLACDVPGTLSILDSGKKAREKKQVFFIDFQIPTDPFNQEVVRHVQAGMIGKVSEITSFYCDQGIDDPPMTDTIESRLRNLVWVNDTALGAGMFGNAGIHSIDAALWVAASRPVWAMGASRQGRKHHGDTHDVYALTYMLENGIIISHRGEHMNNQHDWICRNMVWGDDGYAELGYMGKAWVRGNNASYRGGEVSNLYINGIKRNLDKFAECIRQEDYSNDTLEKGVNSNLAVLLGREAGIRQSKVTMEQILNENRKLEFDTSGLRT